MLVLPGITLGPKRTVELYQVWMQVLAKPALGHGTDTSRQNELTGMTNGDNQSLLAAIHNWSHISRPRSERPKEAAPWERYAVYFAGAAMLAGIGFASGFRRRDSRGDLLILAGLLIGLSFVVSPIVHSFYRLMLLPLVAALLDQGLPKETGRTLDWKLIVPVLVFVLTDFLTQIPGIGDTLRDLGAPLLSLMYLLWTGAMVLIRGKENQTAVQASR
jgi:hypothetical protein